MDEPEGDPATIAEEAKRLHALWSKPPPQGPPDPVEVDPSTSYWTIPPPDPAPTGRRIGWLMVGIGAAAIVSLAAYFAFSEPPADPNDPGSADIAFGLSPFIAVVAAMATAFMLWAVGSLRLADVTVARARKSLVAGIFGGPAIYLVFLVAAVGWLDEAHSGELINYVSFLVPTVSGVGVTLAVALVQRR